MLIPLLPDINILPFLKILWTPTNILILILILLILWKERGGKE